MIYKVNLDDKEFVILLRKRKGSSTVCACVYCKYSLNKAFSELQEHQHCDREKIARDTGGIRYDESISFCTYLEDEYLNNLMYVSCRDKPIYGNEFISNIIPIGIGDSIYKCKYILKHKDNDRMLRIKIYDRIL